MAKEKHVLLLESMLVYALVCTFTRSHVGIRFSSGASMNCSRQRYLGRLGMGN